MSGDIVSRVHSNDSGSGGAFTAAAILPPAMHITQEYEVVFDISHYGDTLHVPYGPKGPVEIARLTTDMVANSLSHDADMVFIACNTASTQYAAVAENIEVLYPGHSGDVIPIIDKTVEAIAEAINEEVAERRRNPTANLTIEVDGGEFEIVPESIHVAVLATRATVKSGAYSKALREIFQDTTLGDDVSKDEKVYAWSPSGSRDREILLRTADITLEDGQSIKIHFVGPPNWVDIVECGAKDQREYAVEQGIGALQSLMPNGTLPIIVAECCTHYPALDSEIRKVYKKVFGIEMPTLQQGELMAQEFEERAMRWIEANNIPKRATPLTQQEVEAIYASPEHQPKIYITGDNLEVTQDLMHTIFEGRPVTCEKIAPFPEVARRTAEIVAFPASGSAASEDPTQPAFAEAPTNPALPWQPMGGDHGRVVKKSAGRGKH